MQDPLDTPAKHPTRPWTPILVVLALVAAAGGTLYVAGTAALTEDPMTGETRDHEPISDDLGDKDPEASDADDSGTSDPVLPDDDLEETTDDVEETVDEADDEVAVDDGTDDADCGCDDGLAVDTGVLR